MAPARGVDGVCTVGLPGFCSERVHGVCIAHAVLKLRALIACMLQHAAFALMWTCIAHGIWAAGTGWTRVSRLMACSRKGWAWACRPMRTWLRLRRAGGRLSWRGQHAASAAQGGQAGATSAAVRRPDRGAAAEAGAVLSTAL
eukprot:366371-Chlamydomonas_euryale.AAC.1